MVLEVDASHLVKRHHIPQAHQPDLARPHVVEQVGDRRLPARHQDGVGADLLVDVTLARAAWPQLADVVVVFHQRNHAGQQMPLGSFLEAGRLHAGGAKEHI